MKDPCATSALFAVGLLLFEADLSDGVRSRDDMCANITVDLPTTSIFCLSHSEITLTLTANGRM